MTDQIQRLKPRPLRTAAVPSPTQGAPLRTLPTEGPAAAAPAGFTPSAASSDMGVGGLKPPSQRRGTHSGRERCQQAWAESPLCLSKVSSVLARHELLTSGAHADSPGGQLVGWKMLEAPGQPWLPAATGPGLPQASTKQQALPWKGGSLPCLGSLIFPLASPGKTITHLGTFALSHQDHSAL